MNYDERHLRYQAIKSLKAKKAFQLHLAIYLVFAVGFIVADWTTNGLQWAWWPILGWGIGVLFNWFAVYRLITSTIPEDEIVREMQRIQ